MLNTRVWSQATAMTIRSVSWRWRCATMSASMPGRGSGPGTSTGAAGRDRLGLGELLVELLLEIAQAREVLVEPRAVLGADRLRQLAGLVEHARQHALARHDVRARREARGVRILETGPEDARVEVERRRLRGVDRVGVLVAEAGAHVAGRGRGQASGSACCGRSVRAIVTSMVSPGLSSLAIGAMPVRQTIQPV